MLEHLFNINTLICIVLLLNVFYGRGRFVYTRACAIARARVFVCVFIYKYLVGTMEVLRELCLNLITSSNSSSTRHKYQRIVSHCVGDRTG